MSDSLNVTDLAGATVPTPEQFLPPDSDPVDPAQLSNLPARPAGWRDQNVRAGVVTLRRWAEVNPMIGVVLSALTAGTQAGQWKSWSLRDAVGLDWLSREGRRVTGEPTSQLGLCSYLEVKPDWLARLTRRHHFAEALQAVRLVNLRLMGPRRDAVMIACALGEREYKVVDKHGLEHTLTMPPDVKWARLWAELDGSLETDGRGAERRVAQTVVEEIRAHMDAVLPEIARTVRMQEAILQNVEVATDAEIVEPGAQG